MHIALLVYVFIVVKIMLFCGEPWIFKQERQGSTKRVNVVTMELLAGASYRSRGMGSTVRFPIGCGVVKSQKLWYKKFM